SRVTRAAVLGGVEGALDVIHRVEQGLACLEAFRIDAVRRSQIADAEAGGSGIATQEEWFVLGAEIARRLAVADAKAGVADWSRQHHERRQAIRLATLQMG